MIKKLTLLLFLLLVLNIEALPPDDRQFGTEISRNGKDFLQVIPSPGNGVFTLVFRSEVKGQKMIAVSDATGKYVYLKTIRDFSGEIKEIIDLSGNPKGIYIFEVESDSNRESKKIIYQ